MPNLCANIGKSMTTLVGDTKLKDKAIALFDSIGSTLWLANEKEIDIEIRHASKVIHLDAHQDFFEELEKEKSFMLIE